MSSALATAVISDSLGFAPGTCGVLVGLIAGDACPEPRWHVLHAAPAPSADLIPEVAAEMEPMLPAGIKIVGVYNAQASALGPSQPQQPRLELTVDGEGAVTSAEKAGSGRVVVVRGPVSVDAISLFVPCDLMAAPAPANQVTSLGLFGPDGCIARFLTAADVVMLDGAQELDGQRTLRCAVTSWKGGAGVPRGGAMEGVVLPAYALRGVAPFAAENMIQLADDAVRRAKVAAAAATSLGPASAVERVGVFIGAFEVSVWCPAGELPRVSAVKSLIKDVFGVSVRSTGIRHPQLGKTANAGAAPGATSPAASPAAALSSRGDSDQRPTALFLVVALAGIVLAAAAFMAASAPR